MEVVTKLTKRALKLTVKDTSFMDKALSSFQTEVESIINSCLQVMILKV